MKILAWRIARLLALLQLLKALELRGVYTIQWARLTSDQFMSSADWAVAAAAFLFLLLPISAVYGLLRGNLWGFYPLIIFPSLATVFGALPIPFVAGVLGEDVTLMSTVILVFNIAFVAIGVLLFRAAGPKSLVEQ